MLHDWYFQVKNPVFEFCGQKFSVELFTRTNRYDLDPDAYPAAALPGQAGRSGRKGG